jgi:predicted CoA-substrate-specific enzyme activase
MIVAGIDIGAGTTKGVILDEYIIAAFDVIPTGHNVKKASDEVMSKLLGQASISSNDIARVISTGYGRHAIGFSDRAVSEITCHAKGVYFLLPETEMIIDIGCQDSKVIILDGDGNVVDFLMNDKCAAGTGRFLEVMAQALGLDIDEMGPESERSGNPCHISSTCTVFAETEIVTLRAAGARRPDLVAGIHQAIAKRVTLMGHGMKLNKIVLTGGVARNAGVKKALEKEFMEKIVIPKRPQITGALGAALIARADLQC